MVRTSNVHDRQLRQRCRRRSKVKKTQVEIQPCAEKCYDTSFFSAEKRSDTLFYYKIVTIKQHKMEKQMTISRKLHAFFQGISSLIQLSPSISLPKTAIKANGNQRTDLQNMTQDRLKIERDIFNAISKTPKEYNSASN